MKSEHRIICAGIFLIVLFTFPIFSIPNSRGDVLEAFNKDAVTGELNMLVVTKEMGAAAIKESERIIEEMQEHNFATFYMNDALLEAKRIFEIAENAEILRNNFFSEEEKAKARETLKLIGWQNINYSNVLFYTDKIKARKERAFMAYDSIAAVEIKIEDYEKKRTNVSGARAIMDKAKTAFYEGRFEDTENLLGQARDNLELKRAQLATFNVLRKNAENFIQKHWFYIIVFLIIFLVAGSVSYKRVCLKLLKNKIKKMKIEKEVLLVMIKKLQEERFKEGTISRLIYNIRANKYTEKLNKIQQILPVFEARLKKELWWQGAIISKIWGNCNAFFKKMTRPSVAVGAPVFNKKG